MTPNFTLTQITGFILEEQTGLTLDDICRACAAAVSKSPAYIAYSA